jgi:hypothetical protein
VQAQRQNDVGNRLSPYRNYLLSQYAHCNIYTQTSFWQSPCFIKAAVLT